MKLKSALALALAIAIGHSLSAQNGLNTPYSQYGLGLSPMPFNMPLASMQGGALLTWASSNTVNPFNPASYAAVESQSFVFDMGFTAQMTRQRDLQTSLYDADGTLGYLAVAFPLAKWWKTSLSLLPLTDVDYRSVSLATLPTVDSGTVRTVYDGTGGVSRLTWGNAFNLIPERLAIGLNTNLLYGAIARGIDYTFDIPMDTLHPYQPQYQSSRRQKTTLVRCLTFDLGLQYFQPLGKDYRLGLGLTCGTPRQMTVRDIALCFTYVTHNGSDYMRDTIFPAPGQSPEYESQLEMPLEIGLGVSFEKKNHWRLALDGGWAQWSGAQYTDPTSLLGNGTSVAYRPTTRLAGAFQLLGDPGANHYTRRITYSLGLHYQQSKLCLTQNDITVGLDEWGLGFGAQLPMRKGKSLLGLSLNYRSFGTATWLKHNTFTIGLSVSSAESWFVKRKYN